ncbi:lysophospholipid acyltransferase family protein [Rufibacter sediminis]|uniref:Lysophospholipid acyltransferase family protein n=1 Tax=Rufibacter sediminis TaxID=2762756 RepID=A0ABR6VW22_9BACT|nr:lysophospholipid acyltransferase family protein [Rufibacter sediminis]MBC3541382.1 lysophospholipid acyltransferase family protein [Rufibacter sediminis]
MHHKPSTNPYSRPELKASQLPLWWLLKGISLLPFPVLYAISTFLYWVLYYVIGYRKKVVRQNLERSFPRKSKAERLKIEKQFFLNLTDIMVESLKLISLSPAELRKRVYSKGKEKVEAQLAQGTSVLVLGAHLGNWEYMSAAGNTIFSDPIDGVYKPLANSFFEEFMKFMRGRFGINLVRMKDTLRHLIRHKAENRIFTLLSDQVPPYGEIQYWTTFLQQDTPFYVGAEKLRSSFKYPSFFIGMRHLRRGYYEIEFQELLPPPAQGVKEEGHPLTEAFAQRLEAFVEQYPAEYLWSHKRWKHQRPKADNPES